MKRKHRLRTPAQFQAARQAAPRGWPHPLLVLYVAPNELARTRVGVTVSHRVGKAVVRNRVRRRIREAARARLPQVPAGHDLLFIARPASGVAGWAELRDAVETVLRRARLLAPATRADVVGV